MSTHILLLLRHAQAVDFVPGRPDAERDLTESGLAQARGVGDHLRAEGVTIDRVLCSSATRTRQTVSEAGVTAATDHLDAIYNAGSDTILAALREVPGDPSCVLVVGHAPGVPALSHDLADPASSDPAALATVGRHFPPATLVRLDFDGEWADLTLARLTAARLA